MSERHASEVQQALLDMDEVKVDPTWALRVPPALAMRRNVLPFASIDGHVYVACANDQDQAALQAVERYVNLPVRAEMADHASLKRALNRIFGHAMTSRGGEGKPLMARTIDVKAAADPDSSDAVALCDELLYAAMVREASDIHIDPGEANVMVRFRVDGVLEPYRQLPTPALTGVISRFKVVSGMDIAEKRAPQDGRFSHRLGTSSQKVDIRVATLPTKYGERMTLRLLALQTESLTVERLGMCERDLVFFQQAIAKPHGMILLTGPTGSGKTTTLYAALRRLMQCRNGNIVTIEDPIEYDIAGVAQVEVDSADKVSFDRALRSVLRHDPDIVMIGEIRDRETAGVAIKAALTGHLVFSTLHTNGAAGVVTRLHDMGVDRFLIAATLRLAVAQRLVRRLCRRCRKPRPLEAAEARALHCPEAAGRTVYEPGGCLYCANRGYAGRLALFELMPSDEALSRAIAEGCDEASMVDRMHQAKIPTLLEDAVEKLFTGEATVRDVLATVMVW
ncbi:MAG TPA: GspE/PulE family protein [Pirellulales bacterium]|jgi:type IV pilus assembly protein PilB|nr:GspE/PulE family protein [Pirellulales bacterium]